MGNIFHLPFLSINLFCTGTCLQLSSHTGQARRAKRAQKKGKGKGKGGKAPGKSKGKSTGRGRGRGRGRSKGQGGRPLKRRKPSVKGESSDDEIHEKMDDNQHFADNHEAYSPSLAHDDMEVDMDELNVGDQPEVEPNGSEPFAEAEADVAGQLMVLGDACEPGGNALSGSPGEPKPLDEAVADQPMAGNAGQPTGDDEAVAEPEGNHSATAASSDDALGMALCHYGDMGAAPRDGDAGMASEDPLEHAVGQDEQLSLQPRAIEEAEEQDQDAQCEENVAGPGPVAPEGERPPVAAIDSIDAGAEAAPRSSGPKVHSTPEILQRLEPCPTFKIRLNFCDHRFPLDTMTKVKDDRWIDKFAQKSFSKGFKISRDWKGALQAVHEHMWQKWSLAQDKHPLAPGVSEQRPGEIDPDVFTDLEPIIAGMPAPKY